jgi:hypothetical protein
MKKKYHFTGLEASERLTQNHVSSPLFDNSSCGRPNDGPKYAIPVSEASGIVGSGGAHHYLMTADA